MDGFVSLDHYPMPASDARIHAISAAAFYGKGIFTTVAILHGKPFLWEKHWDRLRENANRLKIDLSDLREEWLTEALFELLRKNGRAHGRARISFLDNAPGGAWHSGEPARPIVLIATADRRSTSLVRVSDSPQTVNSTSPLAGVKSCNYLEPLLALEDANDRGFSEAIRLNERGEVASACVANLFWLKDKRLFTPSLKTGCLSGTTREFILENLECEQVEVGPDVLRTADEIFLTSAGIGVVQVAELDGRKLRCGEHPIMKVLPF